MKEKINIYENNKILGIIYALLGGIAWGISATSGQYLMRFDNIDSKWLTVVRLIVSGVVLLIIGFTTNRQNAIKAIKDKRDFKKLIIFGIFGLVVCQYTYLTAIYYTNAGTATVLQYLGPIMIVIYVCIKALRLPTKIEVISIAMAIFGTFILATHGKFGELIISREGLFWGLLSALGLVLYTLLPGDLISKYGSIIVTGYGMLIGGIVLFFGIRAWEYSITITGPILLGLFGIVGLGTIVAYTLYLKGVSMIGPVKASLIACIEPVSAVFFSSLLLKTPFERIDLIGIALILTAVIFLSKN